MTKSILKILPDGLRKKLERIVYDTFDLYAVKSYAQEGEDIILKRIFGNKQHGFYIDVGAHHPKRFSNTYIFYKAGWSGINIDAMPGSMKAFDKLRPRDINVETPVSDKEEELEYYIFNDTALNGFSKEVADTRGNKYKIVDVVKLKTKPLAKILDEILKTPKPIDFLSIDVEGYDYNVLKSNDWTKYHPQVVLIEARAANLEDVYQSDVYGFMKEKRYSLFAKTFNTLFFTSNR